MQVTLPADKPVYLSGFEPHSVYDCNKIPKYLNAANLLKIFEDFEGGSDFDDGIVDFQKVMLVLKEKIYLNFRTSIYQHSEDAI